MKVFTGPLSSGIGISLKKKARDAKRNMSPIRILTIMYATFMVSFWAGYFLDVASETVFSWLRPCSKAGPIILSIPTTRSIALDVKVCLPVMVQVMEVWLFSGLNVNSVTAVEGNGLMN